MSAITTHVLDTAKGRPAGGINVTLEFHSAEHGWKLAGKGHTDADGRVRDLLPADKRLEKGTYRLTFDVTPYFRAQNIEAFFPEATITFAVRDTAQHYHVPLLLSPFSYSTYRGS
jgi:5-hydroxyisourate hydrolase